jgi:hypothetical protein
MKTLVLAMLLAVMQAAPPVPGQASNNQTGARNNVQKDTANKQSGAAAATNPPIAPQKQATAAPNQTNRKEPSQADTSKSPVVSEGASVTKSWWDKASVILAWMLVNYTLALVAVGAIGVGVAWRTLGILEQQTKAALASANASLRQAQYLINAERPLLMVEASGFPTVTIKAVNRGKSTARIVFWNQVPSVSTPLNTERMEEPWYGHTYGDSRMEIINIPPVPPGEEMNLGTYPTEVIKENDPARWEEIRTVKRVFYVYSAVKYKGFLSDDVYESRWCFRVTSGGPQMAGDPGYNQYT